MKNQKILTILVTFIGITVLTHAKEDQAIQYYKDYEKACGSLNPHPKKSKKSTAQLKKIIPDNAFGGNKAQGKYNQKEQTALIKDDQTTYAFKVIGQSRNPMIPEKFIGNENIVMIGSFSTINKKKPEMPITSYLFGTLLPNPYTPATKANVPVIGPDLSDYTSVDFTFNPAGKFSGDGLVGNYYSDSKTAKIYDPTGVNTQNYSFKNVFAPTKGTAFMSRNLVNIGSYSPAPRCENGICSHARILIDLYGYQTIDEDKNQTTQEPQPKE